MVNHLIPIIWVFIFINSYHVILGEVHSLRITIDYRLPNTEGVVMGIDNPTPRFSWSFPAGAYLHQQNYYSIHVVEDDIIIVSRKKKTCLKAEINNIDFFQFDSVRKTSIFVFNFN